MSDQKKPLEGLESLRSCEFQFAINDAEKKLRGSFTTLGGNFTIVGQDKDTFGWKLAFRLNPVDTLLFERMLQKLQNMKENDKESLRITEYKDRATNTIGVLRVGRSEKGTPYLKMEGINGTGEKCSLTFPFLMMPSLRPLDESERMDLGMLTVDAALLWMQRDMPVGRVMHNRSDPNAKKRFLERQRRPNNSGPTAATPSNTSSDEEEVAF